jgi:membrane protease YdiL (CAAX protease family)
VLSLWRRLPVIAGAILAGVFVALVGTTPWAVLVSLNTRHWPSLPWAVPPTALYLWVLWRYLQGAGWPQSTADARRISCRANRLPDDVWGAAILAGIVGLAALVLLLRVLNRLIVLPPQQDLDPSQFPPTTVLLWVLMGSIVAGVVEEAAFRGYLQGTIERRHGPVIAILVTGSIFGFAHLTHPEVTLVLLPYYLAVAAVYGVLAYLTNSILPSLVLHAGGNMLSAFDLFTAGTSEWQAASSPQALIWQTGIDTSFVLSALAALLVGAAAIWAYSKLAAVVRKHEKTRTANAATSS